MLIRVECFTSISDVPVQAWDSLAPRAKVCLESDYLRSFEVAGINDLKPHYLVGFAGTEPVGIAYCFAVDLDLSTLGSEIPESSIDAIKSWYPTFMRFRVLEVGVISSLGSTIAAKPEHFAGFVQAIAPELDRLGKQEQADFALIRDISTADYERFKPFEQAGYKPILGFPTARMRLRWSTFDDYLSDLTSRKRYNLRKKLKKLEEPELSVEIIEDYGKHADRLLDLWEQVSSRAEEYRHEQFNRKYFEALSHQLPKRSHIIAIRRGPTILGFALCLEGDEEYFFAYVGLDNAAREKYDLYFNLILQGLRVAIERHKNYVDFGITTYDFKAEIGCDLVPYVYMLKHLRQPSQTSALADMFRRAIRQPVNRFQVFKDEDEAEVANRPQPQDAAKLIVPQRRADLFNKLNDFVRADTIRTLNLYAFFPSFEGPQEPLITYEGRRIIMLGTNSYMGLATHPEVRAAAKQAIDRYGAGCSGSPFLNGTLDAHTELARSLARFMRKDAAVLFSTGYQTNLAVVSTLAGKDDVIIMDERNHASLIDGARLSRATVLPYKHNDMGELEQLLMQTEHAPKLVLVDSLFSMEGTMADIPEIVRLSKRYNARIMVDESHAIGVLGEGGRGVCEHFGLLDQIDIVMGTFSKSLAAQGGFVAGDAAIIDSLRHQARGHMFSASLAPPIIGTVQKALEIIMREPERRKRVVENARYLAEGLQGLGYDAAFKGGAVVPLAAGEELLTLALFHKLFAEGVFVNPVLHPAVPKNAEMLRISLMATCSRETLDDALKAFERVRTRSFPRGRNA